MQIANLSAIDANTLLLGNQAFTFIGNSAFGHISGQLQLSSGVLSGDVNGDALADFHIELIGVNALQPSDFVL